MGALVHISDEIRGMLNDSALRDAINGTAGGVTCSICRQWVPEHTDETVNLIAFRRRSDDMLQLEYAHDGCSEGRVITVTELPQAPGTGDPAGRPPAAEDGGPPALKWALAPRLGVSPMILLALDADHIEHVPMSGETLVDVLRTFGFRSGRPSEHIAPPVSKDITCYRDGSYLRLETPHGVETILLPDDTDWEPPLRVAAHEQQFVLIVGQDLRLGEGTFEFVDELLKMNAAVAGTVMYADPDLRDRPLGTPERPTGLRRLLPSARRRYLRHRRTA